MGAGADRTTATPTRGVGMGAGVRWVTAALALGARTGTGWASVIPTGETDTGAGTSGALLPWGRDKQTSRSSLYIVQNRYIYTGRVYVNWVGSNTGMKQCQKQSLGMQHEQFPQRLASKHSEQVLTHMGVGHKTRPDQTAPWHPVQVS